MYFLSGGQVVKIQHVKINNRRKAFSVKVRGREYWYPYALLEYIPDPDDRINRVFVDPEIGCEGFCVVMDSGNVQTVHMEQVLEYNRDPGFLRDQVLYSLTLEAGKRLEKCALSRREIIRRLGTSAAQFYRLIDHANYRKSIDQMLRLLSILDCDVNIRVTSRTA